jgi:SAM-dependent methyltransferase
LTATQDQTPGGQVYFDELAELFERFSADTDPTYRTWVERAVPDRGQRAVDLGCGTGRFVDLIAARYQSVLAVDIAEREVDMARSKYPRPNIDYQVRSLLDVSTDQDGQFDLVFSVNTIHHLQDNERVLPQMKSLVMPGGYAVIVDIVNPVGPDEWTSLDWHISEAFHAAEDSYRHRSRTVEGAIDVLRLRLHPTWLEHAMNHTPLSREEFHSVYNAVFPGATFDDLRPDVAAMHWRAPV